MKGRGLSFLKFRPGELIFREGDIGDSGFIIESGKVEISVQTEKGPNVVAVLEPGDIFGEMAIIADTTRSATAKCVETCNLCVVSKSQLKQRVEGADPIVRMLLKVLTARLRVEIRSTEKRIQEVKRQISELSEPSEQNEVSQVAIPITDKDKDSRSAIDKIRLEAQLAEAIDKDELDLHYQPIVQIADAKVIGFEGLLRWKHPQMGFVRPDIFIQLSEETDLILPIGRWVIQRGLRDFSTLKNLIPGLEYLSLNVSGKQLKDNRFFAHFKKCLKQYNVKPVQINLEITETTLIHQADAEAWIRECQRIGVNVGLDDFGTGYSSLGNLGKFKINKLKLDRTFIDQTLSDPKSYIILKSVIHMSHEMKLDTIAEGVETAKQAEILLSMHCPYAQGYYFGRPDSLENIVKRYNKKVA